METSAFGGSNYYGTRVGLDDGFDELDEELDYELDDDFVDNADEWDYRTDSDEEHNAESVSESEAEAESLTNLPNSRARMSVPVGQTTEAELLVLDSKTETSVSS